MPYSSILLNVPNTIGHARMVLFLLGLLQFDNPNWFLPFYCTSAILDGFDGFFARRLHQTSTFGAWYDVVIDVICRGTTWCFITKWGYFVASVEWMTFLATSHIGTQWKIPEKDFPGVCKAVMEKGFKTPLGVYAILGVHVLPIWLYGYYSDVFTWIQLPAMIQHLVTVILIAGRALAFRVEVFYIWRHILSLLQADEKKVEENQTDIGCAE